MTMISMMFQEWIFLILNKMHIFSHNKKESLNGDSFLHEMNHI